MLFIVMYIQDTCLFFQYNMLPIAKASEQSVGIVSNAISPSVTNLGLFRANDEGVARAQVVFLS